LLEDHCPVGAVAFERHQLAVDLIDELDRLTAQRRVLGSRIRSAVAASGTSLTNVFGIGR
jgi:hypothetical protein